MGNRRIKRSVESVEADMIPIPKEECRTKLLYIKSRPKTTFHKTQGKYSLSSFATGKNAADRKIEMRKETANSKCLFLTLQGVPKMKEMDPLIPEALRRRG